MQTQTKTESGPVQHIVMPWCDILLEAVLRQKGGSFSVAFGWTIGWNGTGWQVFYKAIDANFRIGHDTYREHDTFREAYDWIRGLSKEQYETIESRVSA